MSQTTVDLFQAALAQITADQVQAAVSTLALIGAIYAVLLQRFEVARQRSEMARNQELNAAATLFAYYNAKIPSLRSAIWRDTHKREKLLLDETADERDAKLKRLLQEHKFVLTRLETLYHQVAK